MVYLGEDMACPTNHCYSPAREQIKGSSKRLFTIWHSVTSQSAISAAIWHHDVTEPYRGRYGTVVLKNSLEPQGAGLSTTLWEPCTTLREA